MTLPRPEGPLPLAHHRRRIAAQAAQAMKPRVLIVEDDPPLREALEIRLRGMGCSVHSAADGIKARWSLLTLDFDVAVLDLGLPHRSGLDVISEVESRLKEPLPIIVLTGADAADRELARTLGAARVLQKPAPLWTVTGAIQDVLGGLPPG